MSDVKQLTRADLKTLTPEAIVAAQNEGRLDHLLSGQPAPEPVAEPDTTVDEEPIVAAGNADQGARGSQPLGQLSRADLHRMSPAAIVEAQTEGRLDDLLGIRR